MGKIEWPDISFDEINNYEVDIKFVSLLYKGLITLLIIPELMVQTFYEILKFKL